MRLLHLADRGTWEAALAAGSYTGSTRGADLAEVGFVHTSSPAQLPGVLLRFYADVDPGTLVLLVVDGDACAAAGSPVRLDEVPGEPEPFAHVYGPIPVVAVLDVLDVPAGPDGAPLAPALPTDIGA